jgi:putative hemolysin
MLSLEIAIVIVLIVINGLLAMSELAIVSSRPSRLAVMLQKNVRGADQALALASDPGRFFSTVQIGITLVGVLSGAFSGATLGLRLNDWFREQGVPGADFLGMALVVTLITYATLIVGELVPKQLALRNPEAVAVKVAPAMTLLAKLSMPLVFVLDLSGKWLLKLLGKDGEAEDKVSEEEIHSLVREAETAGVLEPGEKEMIAGVMRLGDRPVGAVMTPRPDVQLIDLSDPWESVRDALLTTPHSRLPVTDGNRDDPVGIIQAKDVLITLLRGEKPELRSLIRSAPVIPSSADARDALAMLRKSTVHLGLVYDEYGAFEGVVTTADILESIVGAFNSEQGPPEPAFVRRDDGSYLIAGWMPVDEVGDLLSLPLPDHRDFHTVAGLVLHHFGVLPEVGDRFDYQDWRFEVLDLDGRRIDKIMASKRGSEVVP